MANIHDWYVAKTGDDGNGGHSFDDALLTIAAAVAAASNGDKIILYPGDYDEAALINASNKNLSIAGIDRYTSKIATTAGVVVDMEDGSKISDLYVQSSGAGSIGVQAFTKEDVLVENSILRGIGDAVTAAVCNGFTMRDCHLHSTFDALNIMASKGLLVDNCYFEVVGDGEANDCAGVFNYADGVFRNCIFDISKDDATAFNIRGLWLENGGGNLIFINCVFKIRAGASNTGDVIGVHVNHADLKVTLINCSFDTASAGNGSVYDIKVDAGTLTEIGCTYDSAKVSGTITSIGTQVADSLNTYDPPTRAEATSDKVEIIEDIDAIPTAGAGATTKEYTVLDGDSNPIDGVEVWITTDIEGEHIIASGVTDALGKVTFYLDDGTYYFWSQKAGYNFTNPDIEEVP